MSIPQNVLDQLNAVQADADAVALAQARLAADTQALLVLISSTYGGFTQPPSPPGPPAGARVPVPTAPGAPGLNGHHRP